jgi:ribosomal protein S18 acetylase RimI-like enzyme
MDNWNDIPEDFLQAPSRPRSKKSPRPSAPQTPASISRATSPAPPTVEAAPEPAATAPPSAATPTLSDTPSDTPAAPSLPTLFSLRPLPPNVRLEPLTPAHLPAFKQLNALTLPIPYPESFYKETMTEPHLSVTLVALWTSSPSSSADDPTASKPRLVGAVRCRLLPSSQLYISTIAVLAPYRAHGIAMHLLQAVVQKAVAEHSVRSVTAHVWEANDEGREWYAKRAFEVLGKEEAYYRKLQPQGALLVRKWIGVGDLLG